MTLFSLSGQGQLVLLKDRLARRKAIAFNSNARTLGLAASPPTITVSGTAPTGTPTPITLPTAGGSSNPETDYLPFLKSTGGWRIKSGAMVQVRGATANNTGSPQYTASAGTITAQGVRFYTVTDDPAPVFQCYGHTEFLRVLVDGQYVDLTGIQTDATNSFATKYLKVDFATVRKFREIVLELADGGVGNVYTSPISTTYAPTEMGPRILCLGDSRGFGGGAVRSGDNLFRQMGDYMGCPDIWNNSVLSTGYLATTGGNNNNAVHRLNDIVRTGVDADLAVVGLGLADAIAIAATTFTRTAFQAQLSAFFTQLRTAAPNLPVVVLGPWHSIAATLANVQQVEADLEAEITARRTAGDTRLALVKTTASGTTTDKAWIAGSGRVGTENNSGNSDLYTAAATSDPSAAGYQYLGRRAADAVVSAVLSMR